MAGRKSLPAYFYMWEANHDDNYKFYYDSQKTDCLCDDHSHFSMCGHTYLQHVKTAQEAAQMIKYEDTTDQDKIKKNLAVDSTTAGQIVKEIQYIHDGTTPPTVTYYVQSPTVEKAAEKTDQTVVTANTDQQKVDVYKINLRNNHKIKAGVLYADDRAYAGVGYQAGRVKAMIYMRVPMAKKL